VARRKEQIEFATGRIRNVGGEAGALTSSRATGYPLGAMATSCNMQQPFSPNLWTLPPYCSSVRRLCGRIQVAPHTIESLAISNSAKFKFS